MDYSPSGSSVHGILQAGILEWVALPSSRGSSWVALPSLQGIFLTQGSNPHLLSSAVAVRFFTTSVTWEAQSFHTLTNFQKCHIFNHNLFYLLLSTRNTKMNDMNFHPQEVSRLAEDVLHKTLPNMCRTLYSLGIQTALQKRGI